MDSVILAPIRRVLSLMSYLLGEEMGTSRPLEPVQKRKIVRPAESCVHVRVQVA